MTYPEDVLKAAREAAIGAVNALHWGGLGIPETCRARTESGQNDHTTEVQAAARAIMAERQRCAGIASRMEIGGIVETPEFITAILGQQERVRNG